MKLMYKVLMVSILVLFLCVPGAWASMNITHNGIFNTSEWTDSATGQRHYKSRPGIPPGHGGGKFDAEYLGFYIDEATNRAHLGLQTDFSLPGGRMYNNQRVKSGDVAFDFGADNSYEAALRFNFGYVGSTTRDHWDNPGTQRDYRLTSVQFITGVTEWEGTTSFDVGNFRAKDGNEQTLALSNFNYEISYRGNPDWVYWDNRGGWYEDRTVDTRYGQLNDHGIEGWFNWDMVAAAMKNAGYAAGTDMKLKWTMECGNDYIWHTTSTPNTPPTPVPEPATLILTGVGLIGFAAIGRKKLHTRP